MVAGSIPDGTNSGGLIPPDFPKSIPMLLWTHIMHACERPVAPHNLKTTVVSPISSLPCVRTHTVRVHASYMSVLCAVVYVPTSTCASYIWYPYEIDSDFEFLSRTSSLYGVRFSHRFVVVNRYFRNFFGARSYSCASII